MQKSDFENRTSKKKYLQQISQLDDETDYEFNINVPKAISLTQRPPPPPPQKKVPSKEKVPPSKHQYSSERACYYFCSFLQSKDIHEIKRVAREMGLPQKFINHLDKDTLCQVICKHTLFLDPTNKMNDCYDLSNHDTSNVAIYAQELGIPIHETDTKDYICAKIVGYLQNEGDDVSEICKNKSPYYGKRFLNDIYPHEKHLSKKELCENIYSARMPPVLLNKELGKDPKSMYSNVPTDIKNIVGDYLAEKPPIKNYYIEFKVVKSKYKYKHIYEPNYELTMSAQELSLAGNIIVSLHHNTKLRIDIIEIVNNKDSITTLNEIDGVDDFVFLTNKIHPRYKLFLEKKYKKELIAILLFIKNYKVYTHIFFADPKRIKEDTIITKLNTYSYYENAAPRAKDISIIEGSYVLKYKSEKSETFNIIKAKIIGFDKQYGLLGVIDQYGNTYRLSNSFIISGIVNLQGGNIFKWITPAPDYIDDEYLRVRII